MSLQHLHIPPPESFTNSPLTPPPTDEKSGNVVLSILEEMKRRRAGKYTTTNCWSAYKLEPEGLNELLQRLKTDTDKSLWGFVEDKVRYDYFPYRSRFVLRMASPIHEILIRRLNAELLHQLSTISHGDGQSARFAREVLDIGSSYFKFGNPRIGQHAPDGQYQHPLAKYPGVVLEVANSQKKKDLPYLADDYILESDGNVRVMIGIKLDYKDPSKATLSIWEPRVVPNNDGKNELVAVQVVADQSFRDDQGNPNESTKINLQLQHFASGAPIQTYGELQDPISISAQMMCEFLDVAVKSIALWQEKTAWTGSSEHWVRKRPRQKTPEEELEERDEKRFS